MRLLAFFTVSLLAGLAFSAPTSNEEGTVLITEEFFPKELEVYSSEYEIVNILVPLNALNFEDDSEDDSDDDDDDNDDANVNVFFFEADVKENGEVIEKGLYILKNKNATKLLDHGREAAAANDDTKLAYFATKEGIYYYNVKKNTAEKYGTLDDSLIGIAKYNGTDLIYVLSEDNVVYKVTEEGTKKEKVEEAENAQQIVLDYENNLYYYTPEKKVFVLGENGLKEVEGLPSNANSVKLLRPPFVIENGIPLVVDDKAYIAYSNGTSEFAEFVLQAKPSAFSMEATIIQYYGYNKKIYEYNILVLMLSEILTELKDFFNDKTDDIQNLATRSRGQFGA